MKKYSPKLAATVIAATLVAGCSSGGGTTSSGDGLGVQTTESNLLVLSSLRPSDGQISVDVIQDICEPGTAATPAVFDDTGMLVTPEQPGEEPVFEPGITTKLGEFTITSRDLVDQSGLTPVEFFPEGLVFTRYQVSYTSPNNFAPTLRDRVFQETLVLPNGTSEATFTVVLMDLDVIIREFQLQTSGSIASYNVKIQAFGAEFNGQPLSVSAETFLEVGNFDLCDA